MVTCNEESLFVFLFFFFFFFFFSRSGAGPSQFFFPHFNEEESIHTYIYVCMYVCMYFGLSACTDPVTP